MTLEQRLNKAQKSILKHVARGGKTHHVRSGELINRYDAIKEEAKSAGIWLEWCGTWGYCPTHTGLDYFA